MEPDLYHNYNGADFLPYVQQLRQNGVVVIPVLTPAGVAKANALFKEALLSFPEYLPHAPGADIKYVGGSFGALGNPSSIHNAFVRHLRWDMHCLLRSFWQQMGQGKGVHVVTDRMCIRRPDGAVAAESWHRDTTPAEFVQAEDEIFGGWINLDLVKPQNFNGLLGSHTSNPIAALTVTDRTSAGFSVFDKEQQKLLEAHRESIEKARWQTTIPPGHLLIFYQELIHEVAKGSKSANGHDEYRLFTAWRLTRAATPLAPCLPDDYFSEMALPLLKSDQPMPMWPKVGYRNGAGAAAMNSAYKWSVKTFIPEALEPWEKTITLPNGDEVYLDKFVVKVMPSLAELYRLMKKPRPVTLAYPGYSQEEQEIYYPHDVADITDRFSLEATGARRCDNCLIKKPKHLCSGCHNARYCSDGCASEHWDRVHQDECT